MGYICFNGVVDGDDGELCVEAVFYGYVVIGYGYDSIGYFEELGEDIICFVFGGDDEDMIDACGAGVVGSFVFDVVIALVCVYGVYGFGSIVDLTMVLPVLKDGTHTLKIFFKYYTGKNYEVPTVISTIAKVTINQGTVVATAFSPDATATINVDIS